MLEDTRTTNLSLLFDRLRSHRDSGVRWRACRALASLQDSAAVPALGQALLRDADAAVRREAAFALGQVGHRSGLPMLETALGSDRDLLVQARSLEAMGKLGGRRATPSVTRHLSHLEPLLSREAAIACWRLADSTALPALVEATHSKDVWTRAFAAYAIEKTPLPALAVPALLALADDRQVVVRAYAARALGRQRSPAAHEGLERAARDPDWRVRVSALRAWGTLGDSLAAPVVTGLSDPEPYVRETAAQSLGMLKLGSAVPALRRATADSDPAVRLAAGRALATTLGEPALADLRALFADSVSWVRVGALDALGQVPGPATVAILEEVARGRAPAGGPASVAERASALDALGALGTHEARDELASALADSSWLVAASAAGAVGAARESTLVPALTRLLRHPPDPREPDATIAVLDAFTALGANARPARPAIEQALGSTDRRVREAAYRAMVAAFGESEARSARTTHPPPAWKSAPLGPYLALLDQAAKGRPRGARLVTDRGTIEIAFRWREAPGTVRNFVELAERGYFDRLSWHRVVPYFVIQDGDPSATGSGGPGYTIRCEYNRLRYDTGAVGMALSGKDTGGSQYFITQSPQPHLDGRYTIFGHVVRGQEVVDRTRRGDRVARIELVP